MSVFDERIYLYDDSENRMRDMRYYTSWVDVDKLFSDNHMSHDALLRFFPDLIRENTPRELRVPCARTKLPKIPSPGAPFSSGAAFSSILL